MVSALGSMVLSPVAALPQGFGLPIGDAALGRLPISSVAASIASPNLQFQNKGQGQPRSATLPSETVNVVEDAPQVSGQPKGVSEDTSAPKLSNSFLAQLLAQQNETSSVQSIEENLIFTESLKYLPSKAAMPQLPVLPESASSAPQSLAQTQQETPEQAASRLISFLTSSDQVKPAANPVLLAQPQIAIANSTPLAQRSLSPERANHASSGVGTSTQTTSLLSSKGHNAYSATYARNAQYSAEQAQHFVTAA